MKCNDAEKLILLNDSKELAQKLDGALAAHLHDCDPCRRFQHAMVEAQLAFPTDQEPSATILNNVKREARWLAPEKKTKIFLLKPALAIAASLMIGLGIFFTAFQNERVGLELMMTETELLEAPDQMVSIMYEGLTEDDLAFNFLMTYEEEI